MGPSWGHLVASWGLLGPSSAIWGPSWPMSGPSWGFLRPSWAHLGAILDLLTTTYYYVLPRTATNYLGLTLTLSTTMDQGPAECAKRLNNFRPLGPTCFREPTRKTCKNTHGRLLGSKWLQKLLLNVGYTYCKVKRIVGKSCSQAVWKS